MSWIPSLADEVRDYVESLHAHSRYWNDAATSDLVAEVLQALEQQHRHLGQEATLWDDINSSSAEQQLLAFWLRVMPTADSFMCEQS